jgi:acetyltransferase-like isoleucine patch superfamily enzyme
MNTPMLYESKIVDVDFGDHVRVMQPVNLYGCEIGDGSFIGPFVEVQRDVSIGRRCRIQSHTFICELVSIGDDTFVGHGVMFINDLFREGGPAGGDRSLWRATEIGSHVSIGSNATILPVRVCDGCVIGAGAVVTKDLLIPGTYAGNPARLLRRLHLSTAPTESSRL